MTDDYDDEDLLDWDYLLTSDQWEDNAEYIKIKNEMPTGWHVVKVINFTARSIQQIEDWLNDNCTKKYKRVGFRSYCAYNVAVQFESAVDAIMFKMRWS